MANSIRTTSNFSTATNATPAPFKAGDRVLCPSLSSEPFTLTSDPYGKRDLLSLVYDGSHFYYDYDGYFVAARDKETGDHKPSLYLSTPANQQAVKTLYGEIADPLAANQPTPCTTQTSPPMINLSAGTLSNIAFDIEYAAQALDDISQTLALIHYDKVPSFTGRSLARLAHSSADTWADILQSTLDDIRATLAMTGDSEGVAHA